MERLPVISSRVGELTSGRPDLKEGLYLGTEAPADGLPLHGPNLFPPQVPALKPVVGEHTDYGLLTFAPTFGNLAPADARIWRALWGGIARLEWPDDSLPDWRGG